MGKQGHVAWAWQAWRRTRGAGATLRLEKGLNLLCDLGQCATARLDCEAKACRAAWAEGKKKGLPRTFAECALELGGSTAESGDH